ncbi:MAG: hypothetical protein ABII82_01915 [Verrucomicrobiota bacterium]
MKPGGKDGRCVCSAYGPPGTGPGLKNLCQKAGLPMIIGTTHIGGTNMSKSLQGPMDFPPLSGSGLEAYLPTPEQFKESLMVAAGAGGSILIGSFLLPRAPAFFQNLPPLAKAGIVLGVAILGGGFAFRFSPQLAVGLIGGLGGLAVATAVSGYANVPITLGFADGGNAVAEAAVALAGLLPEERHLGALGAASVRSVDRSTMSGFGVTVRKVQDPALGSWLS